MQTGTGIAGLTSSCRASRPYAGTGNGLLGHGKRALVQDKTAAALRDGFRNIPKKRSITKA